jgi:MFS transporter, FHS family, glucose/mannose:H+ symporter
MMPSETQLLPAKQSSAQNTIFALLCGGFIVNGIIITFIGPILPHLINKWQLDDGHAALFFSTQFIGSFIGVLASSALVPARGFKPAITLGLFMMGIGFPLFDAPYYALALAASVFFGVGYGLMTPGTNLWVAESYGDRRASALNLANLAWGVGAVSCASLVRLALRTHHLDALLIAVGAVCCLLGAALLRLPFGRPLEREKNGARSAKTALGIAVLLGILFFVYVGTENAISGWAAAHAKRATVWNSDAWILAPMFFFGGLLGGRAAGAAIVLRLREVAVAVGGLLLAAFGDFTFLLATSPAVLFAGVFLAGLGLSSVYPIFIAWLSKWFGPRARSVGGVLFALASLGGAGMPPLVGLVSRETLSLRFGLLVPFAGCAVMLAVIALLRPGSRG